MHSLRGHLLAARPVGINLPRRYTSGGSSPYTPTSSSPARTAACCRSARARNSACRRRSAIASSLQRANHFPTDGRGYGSSKAIFCDFPSGPPSMVNPKSRSPSRAACRNGSPTNTLIGLTVAIASTLARPGRGGPAPRRCGHLCPVPSHHSGRVRVASDERCYQRCRPCGSALWAVY